MLWLVFLAAAIALGLAEPSAEPDSSPTSVFLQPNRDHRGRDYDRDRDYDLRDRDYHGPDIRHMPGVSDIQEIIDDVNSPDYYQPRIVLDYRYMKTGGRDYVQGPGGQYLILPPGIRSNQPKEFSDFDALLDHLKRKRMNREGRTWDKRDVKEDTEDTPSDAQ